MILEIVLAALVTCDPRVTALFTPVRPLLGRYEACTTPASLDETVTATDGLHAAPAEMLDPADGFGAAGPYDRGALNRLYGGRRVRVVHGWRQTGEGFESISFVSPFPNADFTKLNSGTLVIRWLLAAVPTTETKDTKER